VKTVIVAIATALVALVASQPAALQPQHARLALELHDYAVLPITLAGFDGRLSDEAIWNLLNYLRSLAPKR
jgi:hypothetical protein